MNYSFYTNSTVTQHGCMQQQSTITATTNTAEIYAREQSGQWFLIAGGVLLGTIGVFVEEAAQHPLVTVWFRCAFGALALLFWGLLTGQLKDLRLRGQCLGVAIITGILMILNWALFFAAISRTSIAVATVVFHIQPFWVILFGVCFLRESVSPQHWIATLVALCGLALSTGLLNDYSEAAAIGSDYVIGLVMCLAGSLSYAAVTVIAKTERRITSYALACWQCTVGMVVLAWTPLVFGWPEPITSWAWLIGLGVIHTGLAYVVLFNGMARLTLGKVALLQFVYPLTAVVVDWIIYGRTLDFIQIFGVGLMAIALWSLKRVKPAIE